jgi:hypothetical protein
VWPHVRCSQHGVTDRTTYCEVGYDHDQPGHAMSVLSTRECGQAANCIARSVAVAILVGYEAVFSRLMSLWLKCNITGARGDNLEEALYISGVNPSW